MSVFDTIPPFLARRSERGWRVTKHYTAPPMPWGIPIDGIAAFLSAIPGLQPASVRSYADVFPSRTRLYHLLSYVPTVRRRFAGALVHARVESRGPGIDRVTGCEHDYVRSVVD